jgi:nitrogenase-associated protein
MREAMVTVVFYEKPGCANNTQQKVLLAAAGHNVWAKNLLTEAWPAARLRLFFGDLPVAQWFNPSAPRIKSGEIDPARLSEDEALLEMESDPLLIRRPLMEAEGRRCVGFDLIEMDAWLGLESMLPQRDPETCTRARPSQSCREAQP